MPPISTVQLSLLCLLSLLAAVPTSECSPIAPLQQQPLRTPNSLCPANMPASKCPIDINLLGVGYDGATFTVLGGTIDYVTWTNNNTATPLYNNAAGIKLTLPDGALCTDGTAAYKQSTSQYSSSQDFMAMVTSRFVSAPLSALSALMGGKAILDGTSAAAWTTTLNQQQSLGQVNREQAFFSISQFSQANPQLDPTFLAQLMTLNSSQDYLGFIKLWGTHVISGLEYGVACRVTLSSSKCSSNAAIAMNASFSVAVEGSVNLNALGNFVSRQTSDLSIKQSQQNCLGFASLYNNQGWVALVPSITPDNARVLRYVVSPLSDYLNDYPTLAAGIAAATTAYLTGAEVTEATCNAAVRLNEYPLRTVLTLISALLISVIVM